MKPELKSKIAKTLADTKKIVADRLKVATKEEEKENQLAESLLKVNNEPTKKGTNTMGISKKVKSDIAQLKMLAKVYSQKNESSYQDELNSLVEKYSEHAVQTKAIETTSSLDASIINDVKGKDLMISFDSKAGDAKLLSLITRVDMKGERSRTIPYDLNDAKLQHLGEVEEMVEQSFDFDDLSITNSRVGLNFKISRTAQDQSIIDQLAYLQSTLSKIVGRDLANGVVNGKSQSKGDADITDPKDIRSKMAGTRVELSDASQVHDFAKAELSYTNIQEFFKKAGPKFRQSKALGDKWVLIAGAREVMKITDLNNGTAQSTYINPMDGVQRAEQVLGVDIVELESIRDVSTNATGYDETGFVNANTTLNDHGILLLINPKAQFYCYDAERVDVEYRPLSDSYSVSLNGRAGWKFVNTSKDKNGVYGVNIGADIGVDGP